MTKYNASATVEWTRLAGGDDEWSQLGELGAGDGQADVEIADAASSVGWSTTVGGVPVSITIAARGTDKTTSTAAAAAVAQQLQLAMKQRATSSADGTVRAVLGALVPPQARAAVKAARVVVGLARSGRLRGLLHRLRGGARVIGRALAETSR